MCAAGRAYTLYKRHISEYKRHTRPRAVRTVRLRVTEWQSGQWQRNAECSRQLAQNFPKERHYRSTTHSGGGGRPLLPPTPETYVGGRRAAAHRRGAPLRGRGVKGGHDGLRPLARGALRALLLPRFRGPVAVQRADLCARRENPEPTFAAPRRESESGGTGVSLVPAGNAQRSARRRRARARGPR